MVTTVYSEAINCDLQPLMRGQTVYSICSLGMAPCPIYSRVEQTTDHKGTRRPPAESVMLELMHAKRKAYVHTAVVHTLTYTCTSS